MASEDKNLTEVLSWLGGMVDMRHVVTLGFVSLLGFLYVSYQANQNRWMKTLENEQSMLQRLDTLDKKVQFVGGVVERAHPTVRLNMPDPPTDSP